MGLNIQKTILTPSAPVTKASLINLKQQSLHTALTKQCKLGNVHTV